MFIEIMGTEFANKGAELMLYAALQKTREAFPKASFVMAPSSNVDYLRRADLGLWQKAWLQRYGVQWGRLGRLLPQQLRRRYGLIIDEEIDVVFDASGFSYSDHWGEKPSVHMASYVKRWKKQKTKVILLPQAMGPFASPKIRKAFTYVVDNADLVFARDDVSYKHVSDLVGKRDNVIQAPDFTNLISGDLPRDPEKYRGRFCLVPNFRMIDKTPDQESGLYTAFCANCVKALIKHGHKPFILIHEGDKDGWLAGKIMEKVGEDIEVVREANALKIKGILGLCAGVISSRFHGLVSALSQGVPALATGWSHKYEMLFREYGIPDGCLPVNIPCADLDKQIERIVNEVAWKEIREKIILASAKYKEKSEEMWQRVFSVITNA